jgi:hypothetical protein
VAVNKGRCWEELQVRGLNQPREDTEMEFARLDGKIEYSRQSEAEDALERERSATDSLRILTSIKLPAIKCGEAVALGYTFRDEYVDKKNCQAIAEQLRGKHKGQPLTIAFLRRQPEIAPYVRKYRGRHTVSGWLAETDPRPKNKRRGMPPKPQG